MDPALHWRAFVNFYVIDDSRNGPRRELMLSSVVILGVCSREFGVFFASKR